LLIKKNIPTYSLFGHYTVPHMSFLPTDSTLYQFPKIHGCNNGNDDVAIVLGASVRLVGSGLPREGRLEVYYNGQWGTVCNDRFGDSDATVACVQLGLG